MKPLLSAALLLAGALLSPALHAAAPMYDIELLLFEQLGSHSGEQWPEYPGAPNLERVVELEARPGRPINEAAIDPSFTPRPRKALNALANAMERSGGYRVLKHIAWRQPSYSERRTRPVRIEAGVEIPASWLGPLEAPVDQGWAPAPTIPGDPVSHRQLEGSAKVHVGKYLHLELDLLYHRNRPTPPQGSLPAEGERVSESRIDAAQPLLETIRVRGHRRMRSKEIHYLDHPLVGALVIAHPYDPEDETPPAQ